MTSTFVRNAVYSALGLALVFLISTTASAAVLQGSVNNTIDGNQNLTYLGDVDWAIWNKEGASATSGSPTNRKNGGSAISDVAAVGGGGVRGLNAIASPANFDFTYLDGTSPTSQVDFLPRAIGNTQLNKVGAGVSFTIDGDPSHPRIASIFVSGYQADGQLTASLNGATTYVDSSPSYAGTKVATLYEIMFQPDNASDVLTVEFVPTAVSNSNAHVELAAVAVQAIPEPATLLIWSLLAGLAVGLGWKRRK